MTFDQTADMQRLIQTLARMDAPCEHACLGADDAILQAIEDANTLYQLIDDAREILKS